MGVLHLSSAAHQTQQGSMSDQTHEPSFLIFDRDMAYVAPIHHTSGEINQVVWAHGKKIGSHELTHSLITLAPIRIFRRFHNRPRMHGFALLLVLTHRGRKRAITSISRAGTLRGCERFQHPLCTCLPTLHSLIDDTQVFVYVRR